MDDTDDSIAMSPKPLGYTYRDSSIRLSFQCVLSALTGLNSVIGVAVGAECGAQLPHVHTIAAGSLLVRLLARACGP